MKEQLEISGVHEGVIIIIILKRIWPIQSITVEIDMYVSV
jgi:hypothetical protein